MNDQDQDQEEHVFGEAQEGNESGTDAPMDMGSSAAPLGWGEDALSEQNEKGQVDESEDSMGDGETVTFAPPPDAVPPPEQATFHRKPSKVIAEIDGTIHPMSDEPPMDKLLLLIDERIEDICPGRYVANAKGFFSRGSRVHPTHWVDISDVFTANS